ncbi:MAG: hypothetical protein JW939_00360, partial [Candidatus Thermoplasmatota archaeon]|nr:hypothetical protein [Candidatus Thermoplasmatota archaeon]
MNAQRPLMVFIAVILIAAPVIAAHHEDYDRAKLDLDTIRYFIASTKEQINRTLEALLVEDIDDAFGGSQNITDHITRIGQTLEDIPTGIDSYSELELVHSGLAAIESNLSVLVERASELLSSVATASAVNISSWNVTGTFEPLQALDGILTSLPDIIKGIDVSLESLSGTMDDLQNSGIVLDHQIMLLSDVSLHYRSMDTDWIVAEVLKNDIMKGLMEGWGKGLHSMANHTGPDIILVQRLDLLRSVPLVSDLALLVNAVVSDLDRVSLSFIQLWDLFRDMEEKEALLEGTYKNRIEGQYKIFRSAQESVEGVTGILLIHREVLSENSHYDNGSVNENLTNLEIWRDRYVEWLNSLDLFDHDLQVMSDLMSRILALQVLDPDTDGDGNLSFEEGADLTMDTLPGELLFNLTRTKEELRAEIMSIEGPLFNTYMPVFSILNITAAEVSTFTSGHLSLVKDLASLCKSETTLTDRQYLALLERSASSYLNMIGSLGAISDTNISLQGSNITFNNSSEPHLFRLLSFYKELLLNVSGARNLTGVYLELDRTVAPYGSEVHARVLIVERNTDGSLTYPHGRTVVFMLDGSNLTETQIYQGSAIVGIPIDNFMSIGRHAVMVSYR